MRRLAGAADQSACTQAVCDTWAFDSVMVVFQGGRREEMNAPSPCSVQAQDTQWCCYHVILLVHQSSFKDRRNELYRLMGESDRLCCHA